MKDFQWDECALVWPVLQPVPSFGHFIDSHQLHGLKGRPGKHRGLESVISPSFANEERDLGLSLYAQRAGAEVLNEVCVRALGSGAAVIQRHL